MGLFDLSGWHVAAWLAGIIVLSGLLVEAMMQYTSALLERLPTRRGRDARSLHELREALLAIRGDEYVVEQRGASGLRVRWDVLGGEPVPNGLRVVLSTVWTARALLDPRRREARWYESVRSGRALIGFAGRRPIVQLRLFYQGGFLSGTWSGYAFLVTERFPPRILAERAFNIDTDQLREAFVACVTTSGWTFRPVTLPLYAAPRWLALTNRVVPTALAKASRRRLWGIAYPATFVLLLGLIFSPLDRVDTWDIALVAIVSASWWGIWGAIAWLLVRGARDGRPARRGRRRSP